MPPPHRPGPRPARIPTTAVAVAFVLVVLAAVALGVGVVIGGSLLLLAVSVGAATLAFVTLGVGYARRSGTPSGGSTAPTAAPAWPATRDAARDVVHSGSPYEQAYGFCRARVVGDRIEVAGTAPVPPPGEDVAATAYAQLLRCGEIALTAIGDLGGAPTDVVRTRMYITDPADADEVGRAHAELFGAAEPVATMVVVAALLDPAWRVELEVEARRP